VPRAKYAKPPGQLPAIEHVQRSKFRFRNSQWDRLRKLLPSKLEALSVPFDYIDAAEASHPPKRPLKTIADVAIHETEGAINSHLTAQLLFSESGKMPTVAKVRAAIRRLRKALEPFTRGWVDIETADIVPSGLDAALAAREQELAKPLPPTHRRTLALLCQAIRAIVTELVCANSASMSEQNVIRYIEFALTCAHIDHPDFTKYPDRLAAIVFPKN
jgi:hypothetical protein